MKFGEYLLGAKFPLINVCTEKAIKGKKRPFNSFKLNLLSVVSQSGFASTDLCVSREIFYHRLEGNENTHAKNVHIVYG